MPITVSFEDWTHGRAPELLSTNKGARELPFQRWRNFKEAFAPELVARAVAASPIEVRTSFDPFGGSGTTGLASQFLGVRPTTIEVNPYLADLIMAKLNSYDVDALARDYGEILSNLTANCDIESAISCLPQTFVEPGVAGRWLFDRDIATRALHLRSAINELKNQSHRRFFRALLGGVLINVCNATTSGKGRRYRSGWATRSRSAQQVDKQFSDAVTMAIGDIHRFADRRCTDHVTLLGDSRQLAGTVKSDIAIFSPPYPNSFDYTDVYNVELWMLGYLKNTGANKRLRTSTLTSHVQLMRDYPLAPIGSPSLKKALKKLVTSRGDLWSRWIPEMVGGYFSDLETVLRGIHNGLSPKGTAWIVIGDSRYMDVTIPTAQIISELVKPSWSVELLEPFRSMRSSPQQGGREELHETLLVLSKVLI